MSSEPKKCKASDAAMRAAESLFVNGFNEEAERLILWQDSTQRDLGGWCRAAVARAREEARKEALEEAAQACERSVVVVTRRPYTHMASMIRALIHPTPQGETKEQQP